MKKLLLGTIFLTVLLVLPVSAMARVDVDIHIALPPLIVFAAPPEVVVIPETNVYVVPDVDVDIFFYNGWWWRPWQGHWYRSRNYGSGWGYYRNVPSFYRGIPSGWRNDYREHRWGGRPWNYQRIPHQQVQQNWRNWEKNRHWEKQNTWGVQGLQPKTRPQQPSRSAPPQQSRPQLKDVKPKRSQQKYQETGPQSREGKLQRTQEQHEKAGPQPGKGKPQRLQQKHQKAEPQSREGNQDRSQEQQGNHQRGNVEKPR